MRNSHLSNSAVKVASKELFPCDFIRFVANMGDDLEQLAFQLEVNHSKNFPEQRVTNLQKAATTKESLGQKIFKLFKPSAQEMPLPDHIARERR